MSVLAYMNFLPAYDSNSGVDKLLDIARVIQQCPNDYVWRGLVFPKPADATLLALASYEDQIPVEAGSYIVGINGYSNQSEGFEFQIYDEGARTNLFGKKLGKNGITTAELVVPAVGDFNLPCQNWLLSPLVILNPGQLNLQITNLSVNTAYIQVLLSIAVPIIGKSINQVEVKKT